MLTLYEYSALPLDQRANTLWANGDFIVNVSTGTKSYNLYALFEFYVEVTVDEEKITEITGFKQGERLEKYLGQITIGY